MRQVVYTPAADRLVYLDEKATPEFWDARWRAEGRAGTSRQDNEIVRVTAKHLPAASRVLEGGCGRANKVKALSDSGFRAIGIDFAAESVRQARLEYPDLDIREGDVRSLPFPSEYFDGYWSIGVIEHFWTGYDAILAEAHRVLRPGRLLFLTAPWYSPYRRMKARNGGYPRCEFESEPEAFYQFALSRHEVSAQLSKHGFDLLRWRGVAPEVSMLEDMAVLRRPIQWLLGSRGSSPKRAIRHVITSALANFCGHSFMAIARRNG
ncbi:MAG: class I SAM-dependent methyltransferase [Steroidobacteraceae bacterium]